MLRIVTDGSIDMPEDWGKRYQIDILSQEVYFNNGEAIKIDHIDNAEFFEYVKQNKMIPKTSLTSPEKIKLFYRQIAKKGDSILSIHVSEKLSGTLSAYKTAARELKNEIKIDFFDSGAGSAALGFMCREARLLSQAGFQTQEIINKLEEIRNKLIVVFTLDTLQYAYYSGRINAVQTAFASLLNIKPIVFLKDGLLEMREKARTRRMALNRIMSFVHNQFGSKLVNLAVVHARDESTANWLIDRMKSKINYQEIIITELSIPVASHLGPGTIGVVAYPIQ